MRTLGLVALLVIAGCVAPARSFEAYEGKAANAAEAAVSATRTAGLAAQAATRGDAFGPYVSVVMAEAEDAASGAESAFASIQPPDPRSDRLRARLTDLLGRTIEVLAGLRIAARRGELDRLADMARPLGPLAAELEAFARAHG